MPRYWRDPADDTVHLSRPGCPIDEFDVIVLPLDQWRRLVEAYHSLEFEGIRSATAEYEIDAIISSVEVPDAV